MRSIAPGEDLIYEFTADFAGVWMYHCGTDPVLHHIANGMFGMLIVEPKGGLPPIDNEFFLVQNEWYLGPQGDISSLEKAAQGAPSPDLVMFNGVAKQYADHPIQVPTGADVRLFVLDAGPSIDSSFHIVGTIFHAVTKEGVRLQAGNDGNWGSQAVDLSRRRARHRAQDSRGWAVPDRDARLQPPRPRGARHAPSGRRQALITGVAGGFVRPFTPLGSVGPRCRTSSATTSPSSGSGVALLLGGLLLGISALDPARQAEPLESSRPTRGVSIRSAIGWSQSQIRYYVFALLFVIFDVEAVFIFPWAAPPSATARSA